MQFIVLMQRTESSMWSETRTCGAKIRVARSLTSGSNSMHRQCFASTYPSCLVDLLGNVSTSVSIIIRLLSLTVAAFITPLWTIYIYDSLHQHQRETSSFPFSFMVGAIHYLGGVALVGQFRITWHQIRRNQRAFRLCPFYRQPVSGLLLEVTCLASSSQLRKTHSINSWLPGDEKSRFQIAGYDVPSNTIQQQLESCIQYLTFKREALIPYGWNDTAEHPVYGDEVNSLFDVIELFISTERRKNRDWKTSGKRINNLTMEGEGLPVLVRGWHCVSTGNHNRRICVHAGGICGKPWCNYGRYGRHRVRTVRRFGNTSRRAPVG